MDRAHTAEEAMEKNEALTYLMTVYGDDVLKVCIVYMKDIGLAQDAAQDTFVKAYRFMDAFIGQEELSEKAWLMRIAINTCKDALRSNWFKRVDKYWDMSAFQEGNESLSAQDWTLMETIMKLPDKLKDTVLLYYYQGMSIDEIAKSLYLSKSSVHKRLEAAKKRLRHDLERWYYDDLELGRVVLQ
jgi:RNA polymerase sigma factor, sigma-70 family